MNDGWIDFSTLKPKLAEVIEVENPHDKTRPLVGVYCGDSTISENSKNGIIYKDSESAPICEMPIYGFQRWRRPYANLVADEHALKVEELPMTFHDPKMVIDPLLQFYPPWIPFEMARPRHNSKIRWSSETPPSSGLGGIYDEGLKMVIQRGGSKNTFQWWYHPENSLTKVEEPMVDNKKDKTQVNSPCAPSSPEEHLKASDKISNPASEGCQSECEHDWLYAKNIRFEPPRYMPGNFYIRYCSKCFKTEVSHDLKDTGFSSSNPCSCIDKVIEALEKVLPPSSGLKQVGKPIHEIMDLWHLLFNFKDRLKELKDKP